MTKDNGREQAQIDYSGLVLGFSSAALCYLGFAPFGEKGFPEKNLDLAKQNIDIISLLSEKTKGNLTPEEEKLTNQLLTDLRMKYVEAVSKK